MYSLVNTKMNKESFKEYISLVGGGCEGILYIPASHVVIFLVITLLWSGRWVSMSWRDALSPSLQDLQLCGYPHIRAQHYVITLQTAICVFTTVKTWSLISVEVMSAGTLFVVVITLHMPEWKHTSEKETQLWEKLISIFILHSCWMWWSPIHTEREVHN